MKFITMNPTVVVSFLTYIIIIYIKEEVKNFFLIFKIFDIIVFMFLYIMYIYIIAFLFFLYTCILKKMLKIFLFNLHGEAIILCIGYIA